MNIIIPRNQLNENNIRIVALLVVIVTLITLAYSWIFLAVILAIDFALRSFTRVPSPLAFIAKSASRYLKLKPKHIFAPPKKFAAALGFIFSILIALFLYLNLLIPAYITGLILVLCATLESVFNICLGCYVYNWIVVPLNRMRKV
ncbi:MAG: DUF4395 domain-containing protein [Fermentimonas sp.]|nr:DUF4395 domain-containing protein [Fermentimonas sp.]